MISCVLVLYMFVVSASSAKNVGTQSTELVLLLNKKFSYVDRELYSNYIYINSSSTIEINLINDNDNVSFLIFQVHSHLYNIAISNTSNSAGLKAKGTNVGLYRPVTPNIDTIYLENPNEIKLKLLVAVHGYYEQDPIPGGCNMEFPIRISPYMGTTYMKDYIYVDAAPARYYSDVQCVEVDIVKVEFYMMYMPARNFEADTYYESIKKLMTLENIRKYADRIPKSLWPMRRMLSAYPGTGAIYVAVAKNDKSPEHYAVYVPTHSYACSPGDEEGCEILDDTLSKFVCASLLFVGIFMCFFGHRFFKTEMFLFGMLTGVVITYILISLTTNLDRPAVVVLLQEDFNFWILFVMIILLIAMILVSVAFVSHILCCSVLALISASVLCGAYFGAIWVSFWWFYGIPFVAVSLPALNMGFLVSAIIYSKLPADVVLLQEDFNFWILFVIIMLLIAMILVSVAFVSNILCCSVLGAYAVVYPIDFYLGSNLKYFIINTVRRATVEKFNKAVLLLPFEWRDSVVVFIWVGLAIAGFIFQHFHNQGRPPFPPPPRCVRPQMPDSSTYYGAIPETSSVTTPVVPSVVVTSALSADYNEKTPLLG